MERIINQFPVQKKSDAEKTEQWRKDCVDAALTILVYSENDPMRMAMEDMVANYNLKKNILNPEDVERTMNPYKIQGATFPAKMQNYPIATPKIDLLLGEESKRRFDWRVTVTNADAISEKEDKEKERILGRLQELANPVQSPDMEQQQIKQEVDKLAKWKKYESQDMRERVASHILNDAWYSQRLKFKFSQGFVDVMYGGEELYCVDIMNNELLVRNVNPLNLYTFGGGESYKLEDRDIIVEDGFASIGTVIDYYYDELSSKDIDYLEGELNKTSGAKKAGMGSLNYRENSSYSVTGLTADMSEYELISFGSSGDRSYFDNNGNVRVSRVVWKSRRKVGKLFYIDPETGNEEYELVPEQYQADKDAGEKVKWIWINEWWEGTKIGEDIYVKMQPRPIQFKSRDSLKVGGSGYVGTFYGMSLMQKMRPYQYMYDSLMYRTELAFAKYKGPMIELDFAKVPKGWNMSQWMYYAELTGYLPIDSFKEGEKGAATGKLAGSFNTTGRAINPDMGNYIKDNFMMMTYVEDQMGQIAGVTKQREGQIDNRETVGGVERAVTQSSHITEWWFMMHDDTKIRVLETVLETYKYLLKNKKSKKAQYILDDLSTVIYDVDGELYNEADYGLQVVNTPATEELMGAMKRLAEMGIQSQMLNFSQFIDIYMSPSIADVRRKIETAEDEKIQREQQSQEAEQEHNKEIQQMVLEDKQKDRELKVYEIDKRFEAATMPDEQEDTSTMEELKKEEIRLKEEQLRITERIADKDRAADEKMNREDNTTKLKIAKSKPKPSGKA